MNLDANSRFDITPNLLKISMFVLHLFDKQKMTKNQVISVKEYLTLHFVFFDNFIPCFVYPLALLPEI